MGFFDRLFGRSSKTVESVTANEESVSAAREPARTDTVERVESVQPQAITIDLSKHCENLDKVLVDLSKGMQVDLSKHTARVAWAIDYSGSMDRLYNNGSIQKLIRRLLPIAMRFDDNGELESWIFSNDCLQLDSVTVDNYVDYVKCVIKRSGMYMGGTNYAPVLLDICDLYDRRQPSDVPAFVMFITDGENWDTRETDAVVRRMSKYNMFVQFVGIGNEDFRYLKSLDNLSGRERDNTGFISVQDINAMDDDELYKAMLSQYKDWLAGKQ